MPILYAIIYIGIILPILYEYKRIKRGKDRRKK